MRKCNDEIYQLAMDQPLFFIFVHSVTIDIFFIISVFLLLGSKMNKQMGTDIDN